MQRFLSVTTFLLFLLICLHFSLGEKPAEKPEKKAEEPVVAEIERGETDTVEEVAIDTGDLPNFGAITDVKEKKAAFFDFMRPFVNAENRRVMSDRRRIMDIQDDLAAEEDDLEWVQALARRYRMSPDRVMDESWFDDLLMRVDQLPVSMVLAQSANESAWGTSRFARLGNNMFGQWCFSKGCGIVPSGRPEGETYEVRKFDSVGDSVSAYFLNINTHPGYQGLRELRSNGRDNQIFISGLYLAPGLHVYSERGAEYVDEISAMIRVNDLVRYDAPIATAEAAEPKEWLDRSSS
ncbi:glucosaminidase domain-containing protein [Spongorhabdus nitratireducens]